MIVHEITQELITISEDSWAIQFGAFINKSYADAYSKRISEALGTDTELVVEDGYYKVRIININEREEVDRLLTLLRENGVTIAWVIRLKAKQQQWVLREVEDTVMTIRETFSDGTMTEITPDMSIQIGAFDQEANALALLSRMTLLVDRKVKVVIEDGLYKVRITGFETADEMTRLLPSLGLFGITDIWVIPVEETTPPVSEQEDTTTVRAVQAVDTLVVEEPVVEPKPTIALQVVVYTRQSEALRAQRRIESRLNLPVEIVEQWGYYRVIITGFFTREETNRYYPELFGLGFTNITLIDNWQ
jgi:cell division protein FtsN